MATAPHDSGGLAQLRGTILLVGAGKMGSALLEGWLALGLSPTRIAVIEPQPTPAITALCKEGILLNPGPAAAGEIAAAVLAVKPQVAAEVLPKLQPFLASSTLVVSIMAGRTLAFLAQSLPG